MIDVKQQIQISLKKERFGILMCRITAIFFILSAFAMIVWNFFLIQNMSILSNFATNIVVFFIWSRMVFIFGSFLIAWFLIFYALKGGKRYEDLLVLAGKSGEPTSEYYERAIKQERLMILIFKLISLLTLSAAIIMMGYTVLISAGLVVLDEVWGDISWSFVVLTAWSRGVFIIANLIFGILSLYQIGAHRASLINYLTKIAK